MPLKFVTGNDNVFQLLGDFVPKPHTRAPPLDPAGDFHPQTSRFCSSKISLKIRWYVDVIDCDRPRPGID